MLASIWRPIIGAGRAAILAGTAAGIGRHAGAALPRRADLLRGWDKYNRGLADRLSDFAAHFVGQIFRTAFGQQIEDGLEWAAETTARC
jgi:hypothetical protein